MQSLQFFLLCIISLASFFLSFGWAATPQSLHRTPFPDIESHFIIQYPGVSTGSIPPLNSLQYLGEHVDYKQQSHQRFQQLYRGFDVIGGYAIFHRQGVRQPIRMNGTIYRDLEADLGSPSPQFIAEAPQVLQAFQARFARGTITEKKVKPVVYLDDNHRANWGYQVSLTVEYVDSRLQKPNALIDATSRQIILQWDDIKTQRVDALATGYGGNPITGEYQYGVHRPYLSIYRDEARGLCTMENKAVRVINLAHHYGGVITPMSFQCSLLDKRTGDAYWAGLMGDGYDRCNSAWSPSNDALYIGGVIDAMYRTWYQQAPLTQANRPMQLVMRVHYGVGYENAFWDGKQMTFGDGGHSMYPLVSLSVGAHEISHGFTDQHAALAYYGQSGGMNEAFSDMAAQAAEYFATGKNNWTIGADILKPSTKLSALRFMDKPSKDGASIDNAKQYKKGMDVHYSSGVYNRLFYLLVTDAHLETKMAFNIMLKANMDYWTPNSSFDDGACGILWAAKDLHIPWVEITRELDEVAIDYQQCLEK